MAYFFFFFSLPDFASLLSLLTLDALPFLLGPLQHPQEDLCFAFFFAIFIIRLHLRLYAGVCYRGPETGLGEGSALNASRIES